MRKVFNNKLLLLIVGILLVSNIAMLFFFVWMKEPRKNNRSERQKSPITEFLEQKIGFDKQQMEAYGKVRQQHRQKMKPLFEDIRLAKVSFYGLLSKPEDNEANLSQAADVIGEKQKNIDLQAFQNFKEIRTLCTPAQQARYDSLIADIIANMWFPVRKGNNRNGEDSLRGRR